MIAQEQKRTILQAKFNLISCQTTMETIDQWQQADQRQYITITNPHSVLLCRRDHQMAQATAEAGLTLPDGTGIIWAANILGYKHCGRVTGPNLMLYLCDHGRTQNLRHFFYGGDEGVVEKLAANLSAKYPGLEVAGTYCPPFRPLGGMEDDEIIERINGTKPDVLWVGLGAPKQEVWMLNHRDKIKAAATIGVGAAFNFHSGNVKWAPAIVRNLGIEWAWRLIQNPRRMWRRNIDSPIFLAKVFAQKFKMMLGKKDSNPIKMPEDT
jgi:N-acetylglucosaminyldiphosphoundecaprenol N-acetyl-beta-D-mannosaminyltransferase